MSACAHQSNAHTQSRAQRIASLPLLWRDGSVSRLCSHHQSRGANDPHIEMKPVEPTSTVGLGYFSRIHSKTTATKNPAKASVTPQLSGHLMAMAMPAKDVAKAINWQNRHHLCVWGLPAAPWSRRRSFATVGSKCPAVLRRIRNADLSYCDLARGVGRFAQIPFSPRPR